MIFVPSGDQRGWMHPRAVVLEMGPPQGDGPSIRNTRSTLPSGRTVQSELCRRAFMRARLASWDDGLFPFTPNQLFLVKT